MAKYIVQHRRGTASQWESKDTIIPKEGELVIEIDEVNSLHKLKIGDGIHTYAELAYLMAGDEIVTQVLAEAKPRIVTVELTTNWTQETEGKYSQVIALDSITEHSRLDLQPDADMLAEFQNLNLIFTTENKNGVITVYSVGDMPLKSYIMQATIIEAELDEACDKIIGTPVGAPTTKADWNQTDESMADYIKNRPFYEVPEKVILDNVTTTLENENDMPYTLHGYIMPDGTRWSGDPDAVEGDEYIIVYNGVEYYDRAEPFEGAENLYVGGSWGDWTTIPVMIDLTTGNIDVPYGTTDPVTISLKKAPIIKRLDDKFLPDTARPSQPDFNQNDPTQANYIKNRPFYEGTEEVTILDNVPVSDGYYYPNGDSTPWVLEGCNPDDVYTVTYSDWGTYTCYAKGNDHIESDDLSITISGSSFMHMGAIPYSGNVTMIKTGNVIKCLDPKFLPKEITEGNVKYTDLAKEDTSYVDYTLNTGISNTVGTNVYTITSINTTSKKITLDTVTGIAELNPSVENPVPCKFKIVFDVFCNIVAVDTANNTVTVDAKTFPDTSIFDASSSSYYTEVDGAILYADSGIDSERNSLFIIGHPELGNGHRTIGDTAVSLGEGNISASASSITSGAGNKALGAYSAVFGTGNTGHYASLVGGRGNRGEGERVLVGGLNNIVKGTDAIVSGTNNEVHNNISGALGDINVVRGNTSYAIGRGLIVPDDKKVAVGQFNKDTIEPDVRFVVGSGTSKSNRADCFKAGMHDNGEKFINIGDKEFIENDLNNAMHLAMNTLIDRPKQDLLFKSITVQLNEGKPEIIMEFNAPTFFNSTVINAFIRQSKVGGPYQLIQNKVTYLDSLDYEGKQYSRKIKMTFNASGGAPSSYTDLAAMYDCSLSFFNIIQYVGDFEYIDGYMSAEQMIDIYGNLMPRNYTARDGGYPIRYTNLFENITDSSELSGVTSYTLTYDVDKTFATEEYVDEKIANIDIGDSFSGNYNDLTNKPTVDQTYSANSSNAQSGKAVAEAIKSKAVSLDLGYSPYGQDGYIAINSSSEEEYLRSNNNYTTSGQLTIYNPTDAVMHNMIFCTDGQEKFTKLSYFGNDGKLLKPCSFTDSSTGRKYFGFKYDSSICTCSGVVFHGFTDFNIRWIDSVNVTDVSYDIYDNGYNKDFIINGKKVLTESDIDSPDSLLRYTEQTLTDEQKAQVIENLGLENLGGDAELIGIRTGLDGTVYDSAGEAVRSQIGNLKENLDNLKEDLVYAPKKNLIDFSKCIMNMELKSNLGAIGTMQGWYVTDWIEVEPNTRYALSGTSSVYKAEVDESKTISTSASSVINGAFTTGADTKYVRFNSKIDGYPTPQLEKGYTATSYEPYTTTSKRILVVEDKVKELDSKVNTNIPKIILPDKIYCAVGVETNLYYENIILCENIANYDIDWSMSSATPFSRVYNECLRLNPTSETVELGCILKIKDKYTEQVITEKSFKLQAVNKTLSKNVIFIGDSLTDRGYYEAEIAKNLSNGGINPVGTLVDNVTIGDTEITINNEGRSGWKADTYVNSAQYNGFTNAFYNPTSETFDFAYYMNNNEFPSIDCVVITLGTNDIAGLDSISGDFEGVVNNINTMINSIHSYNSNIKVIVSLMTPGAEQDGWGKTNGRTGSACAFNFRQKKLVSMLIDEFDNKYTNVYISPNYVNIDTHRDFPTVSEKASNRNAEMITRQTDNVHPTIEGYLKIADIIWGTMLGVL